MVTNGDFSSGGANWDTFGAVTFSDGMAIASGNNWILSQLLPGLAGGQYAVGLTYLLDQAGSIQIWFGNRGAGTLNETTSSPTIHSAVVLGQGDTLLHFNGQGDAMVTDITVSPL